MANVVGTSAKATEHTFDVVIDTKTGAVVKKYNVDDTPVNFTDIKKEKPGIASPTVTTGDQSRTQKEAKIAEKEITERYTEGTLTVLPSPYLTAKKVYNVTGVGRFTGAYYAKKIKHKMNGSGYSVSLDVIQVLDKPLTPATAASEPIPLAAPVVPADPKYTTITIVRGDTLWALSRKYGTTVAELAKINGIANPNLIIAGKSLKVPAK